MRRLSAEAIVLDVVDLHERDRIVTLLTAPYGKVRGVARGARRKYSRFSGQLQPLAKVRVTWFEREGRELVRISDADLVRPAARLQSTLEGILLAGYLADHMLEFAQENEASEHLYRLLDSTLEALAAGVEQNLAARYFEVWVLRLAGIFPPPRECPLCGRPFAGGAVLPPSGEALTCADCAGEAPGGLTVPPAVMDFLRRSAGENLPRMAQGALTGGALTGGALTGGALTGGAPAGETLAAVEELCGRIRRPFLGRELRSYEVMKRTLRGLEG
jgi:DNA repair protein RecO (recombination protein O)